MQMRSPLKAPERQNNRQQDKTRTATNGGEEIKAWEFIDILSWIQVGLRQRTESEPVPKKEIFVIVHHFEQLNKGNMLNSC